MTTQATPQSPPVDTSAEIRPLSPEDLRAGPAFLQQVNGLMKLCNERLANRDRVVVIGSHVPAGEIREVVSRFAAVGWNVKRSKVKNDPNAIELRFREKRKPPTSPAPKTAKKKGVRKPAQTLAIGDKGVGGSPSPAA